MTEDSFFDSDGVKLRYTIDGEGPPVVLIDGLRHRGDANGGVTGMIRLLAKNYRVITIDNRGHDEATNPRIPRITARKWPRMSFDFSITSK